MFMIMWELNEKSISAEDVNVALSKHDLPPTASPDTSSRSFRQSWRKFSSLHTERFQTHMISENEVAVIERSKDGAKLNLDHLGTIKITEYSRGNVAFHYVCLSCGHHNSLKSDSFVNCSGPNCNTPIPGAVRDIAAVFKKKLDAMSPEGRSMFYVNYSKDLLKTVPFMSAGRPYLFADSKKKEALAFSEALHDIGDKCYVLDLQNNEDAQKIVRAGIAAEIKTLRDRYERLTTSSDTIRERRLSDIRECKAKIDLYKDVLGSYMEDLNKMADDFKALVLLDLHPQSQTRLPSEDPQVPDSDPSECPSSSETTHPISSSLVEPQTSPTPGPALS